MASVLQIIGLIRNGTRTTHTIVSKQMCNRWPSGEKVFEDLSSRRRYVPACRLCMRHQSTRTHSRQEQGQTKRRVKKKLTTDVIQVKEESISQSRAKIKRLTSKSFDVDKTLGILPATSFHGTPSQAAAAASLGLDASPEDIADLLYPTSLESSEVPSNSLNFPDRNSVASGEDVRWPEVDAHESVISNSDIGNSYIHSSNIADTLRTLEGSISEGSTGLEDNVNYGERTSADLRGLEDLMCDVTSFKNIPSLDINKISEDVIRSVESKEKLQKKKSRTVTEKSIKSGQEEDFIALENEEDMFLDRDQFRDLWSSGNEGHKNTKIEDTTQAQKKKKTKAQVEQENRKLIEEAKRRGREVSFNQTLEAYLSVCVNVGMLNRATHTLMYYRRLAKSTSSLPVKSVGAYNVLFFGHAEKGNYRRMKELLGVMQEDMLVPDCNTYISFLVCLATQPATPKTTKRVEELISQLESKGMTLQQLFLEGEFIRDHREKVLKAIQLVQPAFDPVPQHPMSSEYLCPLVDHLNKSIYSSKVPSPAEGVVNKEDLRKWTEEQFKMEQKGYLQIKSIENKEVTSEVQFFRDKLMSWEERWKEVMFKTFIAHVESMKKSFFGNKRDKQMTLYPYLVALPPEDYINIMLQELTFLASSSEAYSPSRHALYRRLGEQIYTRYLIEYKKNTGVLEKLASVYEEYNNWFLRDSADKNSDISYVPRIEWQRLVQKYNKGPSLEHTDREWPNTVLLGLGQFLYKIILTKVMVWKPLHSEKHTYPAMYEVDRSYGYRVVEEIKPSPTLLEVCRRAARPTLTFDAVVAPMVCPPVPWVSTRSGGYLLSGAKIVRLPYNAFQQKQRMDESGSQQLYPVMDALNQLGSIPWIVNQSILDVVLEVFNNNGSVELDIPQPPSACPQPTPIKPGMSQAEIRACKKERMEFHKKKSEMHSLWCDALYKLSLANHFRDQVFWFPHNMDFRGRVYPCPPHLNHMSSDVFRSILKFGRGEKLGPRGLRWLKLHLINLTGIKKRDSVEDRLKYCEEVMDDIIDSADNPLNGRRWWVESDEPWQTLAACKELTAALRSDDPSEFVSHLPIHQDGSCNGLQHYAALGRDKSGAESVNLAPAKVPQDVYSAVAALVEEERKKDVMNGKDIAKVLEGFIRRKVIKQTVMTTVYGVTRYGARLQIEKQLKALEDFPVEQRWAASQYLVRKTFLSLEQMFTATKEIQDWLTECARMVAQVCGENIEWVTPLGLPVVQPYSKACGNKISIRRLPTTYSMDSFVRPNVMKQKNAFPPNFIHSLDSTHMMLTSLHCQEAGITYVSVHDCFWSHASSVDIMSQICREQFVALHKQPILDDLSVFLKERFGFSYEEFDHDGSSGDSAKSKLNNLLTGVPETGDFDISNVLKSVYFFS
ncbi:mitochondrial RNA polymerase [Oratosquilla oratoria]|uniref:mitochondrial RNA polymerase n=1 Tax=Oratosquilla oratoria TaxID=337810 RepID=UPI003F75D21C